MIGILFLYVEYKNFKHDYFPTHKDLEHFVDNLIFGIIIPI